MSKKIKLLLSVILLLNFSCAEVNKTIIGEYNFSLNKGDTRGITVLKIKRHNKFIDIYKEYLVEGRQTYIKRKGRWEYYNDTLSLVYNPSIFEIDSIKLVLDTQSSDLIFRLDTIGFFKKLNNFSIVSLKNYK